MKSLSLPVMRAYKGCVVISCENEIASALPGNDNGESLNLSKFSIATR